MGDVDSPSLYAGLGSEPVNREDPWGLYWKAIFHGISVSYVHGRHYELNYNWVWVPEGPDDKRTTENMAGKVPAGGSAEDVAAATYFLNGYDDNTKRFYRWEFSIDKRWHRPFDEMGRDPMLPRQQKGLFGFGGAAIIAEEKLKEYPVDVAKGVVEWYVTAGIFKGVELLAEAGNLTKVAARRYKIWQDAYKSAKQAESAGAKASSEIVKGTLKRGNIAANIAGGVPEGYAGHHLITIAEANRYPVMKRAAGIGYDINRGANGIALPRSVELAGETGKTLHSGRHVSEYTDIVESQLRRLQNRFDAGAITEKTLLEEVGKIEEKLRQAILNKEVRLQYNDPAFVK